jgi:hypothetical protein
MAAAVFVVAANFIGAASAQENGTSAARTVVISGSAGSALNFSETDLRALPATEVTVSFETSHGLEQGTFRGVLLWSLLSKAGITDAPAKSSHLAHTISVEGRDGYKVALSIGEVDPKFEGKSVIVAYDRDGKPDSESDGLRPRATAMVAATSAMSCRLPCVEERDSA